MPFAEIFGNKGTTSPEQMDKEVPNVNTGVTTGFTDTVRVVVVAQVPEDGVKVYVAEFWLSMDDGFQVPVIPFVEMDGRDGTAAPAQTVRKLPKLNVGTILGLTVTEKLADVAHCPASGVKVYVAEFWSSTVAGLQLPVIPLVEVVTSEGTDWPAQMVSEVP